MLSIKEALRLMQQCFDTITNQAAEDYVEAVDVMRCYEDFSQNPLDVDALERLVAAFEKWYGASAIQAAPVANATPGPWQLGEPESESQNYALASIWGGCLADPTGRHFIVGYAVLQNGEPTKPLVPGAPKMRPSWLPAWICMPPHAPCWTRNAATWMISTRLSAWLPRQWPRSSAPRSPSWNRFSN